jgi:DNA-binding response OmpR family regulator
MVEKKILIVDSGDSLKNVYTPALKRAGYDVTFLVYDGKPLNLGGKKFDVAVVDRSIGRGMLRKVCEQINTEKAAEIKIFYSGDPEDSKDAQEVEWRHREYGDLAKIIQEEEQK